jgi:hypothetical protein
MIFSTDQGFYLHFEIIFLSFQPMFKENEVFQF